MSYKTILVCLNDVDRLKVLLSVVGELALRQDAHVIGLYVVPAVRIYPVTGFEIAPTIYEGYREFFESKSEMVRSAFEEELRRQGVRAEWSLVNSNSSEIANATVEHGLASDLIVIGQVDPGNVFGIEADFAERVVMEAGRPVLLVPRYGNFQQCGKRVVLGWNGTRESARAAFDAVPLLKHAEAVHVTWVDPQKTLEAPDTLPGAELSEALSRHGIKATADGYTTGGLEAGVALLNHVSDVGADLLVMGAYGHSRLREFVFGGATRLMLDSATVPVLMSH